LDLDKARAGIVATLQKRIHQEYRARELSLTPIARDVTEFMNKYKLTCTKNDAPSQSEKTDLIVTLIAKMINKRISLLYRGVLCESERFAIVDWMYINNFPSKEGVDHIDFSRILDHDYGVVDTLYKHSLDGRSSS
jgi:hypothetical protein